MELLQRFRQYADDFEQTYEDDDWGRLEPYFADDAVYRVEGLPAFPIDAHGRDAVLAALRDSVNGFDRCCASRKLELLAPPKVTDDTVSIFWRGTYTLEGAPDLVMDAHEDAHYDADGRITRLVDRYPADAATTIGQWLAQHGPRLARA